jgi:hypothetical protein
VKRIVLYVVALFIAATPQSIVAQPTNEAKKTKDTAEDVDRDKHSKQAEETAKKLRRQIEEEIKTLGNHPWAGDYYFGDGMGVNVLLILAPKSGYLFEWHGCMGLYDRNYGAVTEIKGRLRLSFTFANKPKGFMGIAEQFIPVSWGDRKYLIPADDVVGFCNAMNGGREPRKKVHGFYLLRFADEKKEAKGLPLLPQEFKPYLLTRPIVADIVGVGRYTSPSGNDWKLKGTPVTLNCGKKQGLLAGMEMHVVKPDDIIGPVTVTKVEEERSEAIVAQSSEKEARPQVRWQLSTRCPWYSTTPP